MLLLLAALLSVDAYAKPPAFGARLYIDSDEISTMTAAAPTEWLFEYFNADTGLPLDHLMAMHDKKVHLIVVSSDLADFAHIHPDAQGRSGLYKIRVNEPSTDPDNADAARAVARGGDYFLFSEFMPPEAPMTMVPLQIRAEGPLSPRPRPALDPASADGTVTKTFGSYRMSMKPMATVSCGMLMVRFWLRIDELDTSGAYRPVGDIQSWLGRNAHGIVVSLDGTTAKEKVVRHIHAIYPDRAPSGPELVLLLDNHQGAFPDGDYKIFIQLKRAGRVSTFPFVMHLEKPREAKTTCKR
jgi:hypothetical protein